MSISTAHAMSRRSFSVGLVERDPTLASTGSGMSAEREQKRRLLEEWTPEPDDPMYEDPLHEEPALGLPLVYEPPILTRAPNPRAPIGMRIRGNRIVAVFALPPGPPAPRPACPPRSCDQAA